MKKVLMFLMFLCSLASSAQDVILKKDGNTVVCRVVEVGSSEVVYKRWSDPKGSNYVMNVADIVSIHFENGEKRDFTTTGNAQPAARYNPQRPLSDAALLNMVGGLDYQVKAKRLRKAGWICGSLMFVSGISSLVVGIIGKNDGSYWGYYDNHYVLPGAIAAGSVLIASGIITTSVCLAKARRLERSQPYRVQSTPVWQEEFTFRNGTTLATGVHSIRDRAFRQSTLGLGFSYRF